jgi:ribosomal protein L11
MVTLKVQMPAGVAKSVPPLSVLFGQHQLPAQKICLEFNRLTTNFLEEVPVSVLVSKSGQNEFKLIVNCPFTTNYIFNKILNNTIKQTDLYDIVCLLEKSSKVKFSRPEFAKNVFSILKSFQPQVVINKN